MNSVIFTEKCRMLENCIINITYPPSATAALYNACFMQKYHLTLSRNYLILKKSTRNRHSLRDQTINFQKSMVLGRHSVQHDNI